MRGVALVALLVGFGVVGCLGDEEDMDRERDGMDGDEGEEGDLSNLIIYDGGGGLGEQFKVIFDERTKPSSCLKTTDQLVAAGKVEDSTYSSRAFRIVSNDEDITVSIFKVDFEVEEYVPAATFNPASSATQGGQTGVTGTAEQPVAANTTQQAGSATAEGDASTGSQKDESASAAAAGEEITAEEVKGDGNGEAASEASEQRDGGDDRARRLQGQDEAAPDTQAKDTIAADASKPLLRVDLSEHASQDNPLIIDGLATDVQVLYGCGREGTARIKMTLHVGKPTKEQTVCFSWIKKCKTGWDRLQIADSENRYVFDKGETNEEWLEDHEEGGVPTKQVATNFNLWVSGPGSVLFSKPVVTSSYPEGLTVDIRGSIAYTDFIEVSDISKETLSVVYTCHTKSEQPIEVTLKLTKHLTDETIHIAWSKHCVPPKAHNLDVLIQACMFGRPRGQATQAVTAGSVSPTFSVTADPKKDAFQVDERRSCSSITLKAPFGEDLPALYPPPQLSFDRQVVDIRFGGSQPKSLEEARQISMRRSIGASPNLLRLYYVCKTAGSSRVTLSLHLEDYQSIDLSWVKACRKPAVRVSKAVTAPGVFFWGIALAASALIICCVFRLYLYAENDSFDAKIGAVKAGSPFAHKYARMNTNEKMGSKGEVQHH
ncbi:unnamed protein product [Vitrella brassicaformis CCMP3155]|uniref:Uncharacterized protein n=1 Tax=Vitrella brassicaformis (strain CCMP3155) TaxID=1169540 RepID=A0A0G4EI54_VITBC|nr:unnamed protein product [Vitrella brassicaformis CCMP3155]|eukprot:CEL95678.1 unnamed protein product [Vitrella brassicaformis CCMP3155]